MSSTSLRNRHIATDSKATRKNQDIRVPKVRLIGSDGNQVGVVSRDEALQMAIDEALDLVEIVPNTDPPVCRIMDFGKYKFDQQKKNSAAKKRQRQQELKELKFRPTTDDGDYAIKLRNLRRFIGEGDKVKVTIRFKGREMAHTELGLQMAQRIEADIKDDVTVEQMPRMEGRQLFMMVAPKKK